MEGTIYYSDVEVTPTIQREIDRAQAVLDQHAPDLNGLCVTCRMTSPCAHREPAVATFYRYYRLCLPRRDPTSARDTAPRTEVAWFKTNA